VSTFRESTSDVCFWCKGTLGSGGILVGHEKQTISTCIECAVDAGQKMRDMGQLRRQAIEIRAFGESHV